MGAITSLFKSPKMPAVRAAPSAPTEANASVQLAGTQSPGNFSSFVSSGIGGLKRKAMGQKSTLIGGA